MTALPGGPFSYFVGEDGRVRRDLTPGEILDVRDTGRGRLWVDIDSTREADWLLLADIFGFHPLAVEDTRSPDCRVKLEEYDGYLFIVVRAVRFATWTPDPYDIHTFNLYLFLGPNYLVTVHAEPSRSVQAAIDRLEAGTDLLARGVGHLAYMVIDALVDFYFPLLDEIDSFVDEIEDGIFAGEGDDVMERIFQLKRVLLALRRHLAPTREVAAALANRPTLYLSPETQVHFRDVYDHVVRQVESMETFRELLTSAMETYLSVLSNRTNEVMKVLSIVATAVLPGTLIASVYGMNFDAMPGLHSPFGFWLVIGGMVLVSAGIVGYVWWRGWL